MQIDAKTVAELWETIKDYVNANKREELITAILQLLVDNDVEIEDLEELKDVDDDLDSALEEVFDDFDLDEDF
jgi:glycine cleavage system regulatory protein